ncbi:hypothetical protein AB0B50_03415 [Streptomyces sp. NPDC041068]|uniref:hypothetical protein n=1 Tax=Streptomyces sp. NPDC041068 TaxID=3155130 RepID=UPI00340BCCAD
MSDLGPGQYRLHGFARPPVTAGPHLVRMTQTIAPDGPLAPSITPVERHALVTAPQFALTPGELRSVFPPPEAVGSFDTRFAQVVLRRRTLPWERLVTVDADPQRRPWLALVLLTESEGAVALDKPVSTAVPAALHGALGITGASGTCDRLDTTLDVVHALFPRPDELELLCHVREVSLGDSELSLGDDDGFLAVVICARLPRPGLAYQACLVSLEGRISELPTATGAPGGSPGGAEAAPGGPAVSFPVLTHWRFRCAPEAGDFGSLMKHLHVGALGTVRDKCPAVAPSGHTVIGHTTRRGEETAAWYRGPLTPREVPRRTAGSPFLTADQGRAVATDGLEDLSLAAAHEVGRLLALSSPRFLASLRDWRRRTLALDLTAAALELVPEVRDLGLTRLTVGQGLGLALIGTLVDGRDPLGAPVPLADAVWALPRFPTDLIVSGTGLRPEVVRHILGDLPVSTDTDPAPPATPLLQTFDGLRDDPGHLDPLRHALHERVREIARQAGLDPDATLFDPNHAPTTLEELFP